MASSDAFMLNSDGSLQAGGRHYLSFADYVRSDYFRGHGKRCGTTAPSLTVHEPAARAVNDCTLALTVIREEYWPDYLYTLPVWFHVIYREDGTGDIPEARIREQMEVLNEDFRALPGTMGGQGIDSRIQFTLAGITRTRNDDWYDNENWEYEDVYKQALNRDPARYVNVYTTSAGGFLGYTYYPQNGVAGEFYDGIVLNSEVVGGRNNERSGLYDQGRTLVHEMGHYLGLLHTFETQGDVCINGYGSGDLVADTPAESEPHYRCFQTRTCGTPDPIDNYMNYTPDLCMDTFTREQNNRAMCVLINYRSLLYRISWQPDTPHPPEETGQTIPPYLFPLLLFDLDSPGG